MFFQDSLSEYTKMAQDHVLSNVKLLDASLSDDSIRSLILIGCQHLF